MTSFATRDPELEKWDRTIEETTAAFLRDGGKIQQIPEGVSAMNPNGAIPLKELANRTFRQRAEKEASEACDL